MDRTDTNPMPHAVRVGLRTGTSPAGKPEPGSAPDLQAVGSKARPRGSSRPEPAAFGRQLALAQESIRQAPVDVVVERGDTLTSLVRAQWASQGRRAEDLSPGQAHRWALQVARDNGLANPDRILVGQRLSVGSFQDAERSLTPSARRLAQVLPSEQPGAGGASAGTPTGSSAVASIVKVQQATADALTNPLLNQTLDRAVDLGFIPAPERRQVHSRIQELALKHGFRPDDFARAVLMESNGLNPRASNGQCHGIIQFCSGPDRGAASAGYAQRPQAILDLSVLRQLDLVDRYFDDTRLRDFRGRDGQVRLDDLYLTILTPTARQERRLSAPLPIAGPQALDLHVGRDRQSPITRSSILAGLHANARQRLGGFSVASLILE